MILSFSAYFIQAIHPLDILLLAISMVFLSAVLFFLMTLFKKMRRLKELNLKKLYQEEIDEILFAFLFENKKNENTFSFPHFTKNLLNPLYKRVAIKSIISLHHNYSGEYSARLEQIYSDWGLANYSMKKLNASKWTFVVEGIRDLSSMNYVKAYQKIQYLRNHKNEMVQTEALLGMIKLKGLQELFKFSNSNLYLNDWIQSNILFLVKKYKIPAPPNLKLLLQSKNESLVLLAIRLITHYKMTPQYDALFTLYQKTESLQLKKEINLELNKLEKTE
ncbi:MAG: hypothetical protein ABJ092_16145 [Gillisia sp.]